MRLYLRIAALGISFILSPLAHAEDYFGDFQPTSPQSKTAAPAAPSANTGSSRILSPSEFAAQVNRLNKDANTRLSNQAAQILPPPPKTDIAPPTTPPPAPAYTPPTTTVSGSTNNQPANYNGFGAQQTGGNKATTGTGTSAPSNSTNWNIQY